jgi:hypothetical protein
VKRLFALIAGGLGLRVLLRRRARPAVVSEAVVAEPADELRAKLAETRADDAPPSANGSVDSRREDVHERARRAIDELRD